MWSSLAVTIRLPWPASKCGHRTHRSRLCARYGTYFLRAKLLRAFSSNSHRCPVTVSRLWRFQQRGRTDAREVRGVGHARFATATLGAPVRMPAFVVSAVSRSCVLKMLQPHCVTGSLTCLDGAPVKVVLFTEQLVFKHLNGCAGPNSGFVVFSGFVNPPSTPRPSS